MHSAPDLTTLLPEEMLVLVFSFVPFDVLWRGVIQSVCKRWRDVVKTTPMLTKRINTEKWKAYETRTIAPRVLHGHTGTVWCLAVGEDGKIYSGSSDCTIRVWSEEGAPLQTLRGHTNIVFGIVLVNGRLYSGSRDKTVRVWSDGVCLNTLVGHERAVMCIAAGTDGTVYSGSADNTIRVWSNDKHIQTLEGHTHNVSALAVGVDGTVYSGSMDCTIRVWLGSAHLGTLEGHTSGVFTLALGPNGDLYSGSIDKTVCIWSDMRLLKVVPQPYRVHALGVGRDAPGVFVGLGAFIHVWTNIDTTKFAAGSAVWAIVVSNGKMYSASGDTKVRVW